MGSKEHLIFAFRFFAMTCIVLLHGYLGDSGILVAIPLAAYVCFRGFNLHEKEEVLVGVVTPRDDLFDEWVKQNSIPGEQYVQVSREEDLGCFDRIEPGLCWEVLGNLYFKARKDVRN